MKSPNPPTEVVVAPSALTFGPDKSGPTVWLSGLMFVHMIRALYLRMLAGHVGLDHLPT